MKKYTFALLSVLLVAAGCQREVTLGNEGETITFSASTSYEQDNLETKGLGEEFFAPETKTAFSGKDENNQVFNETSQRERIDWQVGDKLFVNMVGTSKTAVYTVGGYQTSSGTDKTVSETTSLTTTTPLTVSGSSVFLATYPADNSIITSQINDNGTFAFKMPEGDLGYTLDKSGNNEEHIVISDNMDYAVMVARASSSNSNVQLHFKPYFNAYQFILGSAPENYILTRVTLSCTDGYLRTKGSATAQGTIDANGALNPNGATLGSASNYSQSITYDFSQAPGYTQTGGLTLSRTDGTIDITLLALPVAQKGISITFSLKQGNNPPVDYTYTLPADKTLQPYKKLRINGIGGSNPIVWTYELEIDDVTPMPAGVASTAYKVRSYKWYEDEGGTRHEEPVAWKTQINLGDRNNAAQAIWTDIASYSSNNASLPAGWISFASTANGTGRTLESGQWESRTMNAQDQVAIQVTGNNPDQYHMSALGSRVHPSGINNFFSSANAIDLSMYDIQGNSSRQNTANCYVVRGAGWYKIPLVYGNGIKNGNNNVTTVASIVDHNGTAISQPGISAQTGIATSSMTGTLVWTDTQGMITDVQVSGNYLLFRLPQNVIRPGNSVIAVKSGNKILWSWHIWVTDQDLQADANGYLTANVGWVDVNVKDGAYKPSRGEMLRIVQLETPGGLQKDFTVLQAGTNFYTTQSFNYGKYTYFQWGRKDPIVASKSRGEAVSNAVYGPDGTQLIADTRSTLQNADGSVNYYTEFSSTAQSVLNPMTMHVSNSRVTLFPDGWSSSRKTLYDPSPIGFRVMPNATAFMDKYRDPYKQGYLKHDERWVWYPGVYMSDGYFLAGCGYRNGLESGGGNQPSALVAPAGVNYQNDNDRYNSRATFWTASGPVIIRCWNGYIIMNDGNSGGTDADWAHAHAIRPVVDN